MHNEYSMVTKWPASVSDNFTFHNDPVCVYCKSYISKGPIVNIFLAYRPVYRYIMLSHAAVHVDTDLINGLVNTTMQVSLPCFLNHDCKLGRLFKSN